MSSIADFDKTIVVTAADSGYFGLAKDAVDSLLDQHRSDVAIGFLDLGLNAEQRDWLTERGVIVAEPRTLLDVPPGVDSSPRQMGYLARPFLRECFPGYAMYVWLDADAWLQDGRGFDELLKGAREFGAAVVTEKESAYRFWLWKVGWMHKNFVKGYGIGRGLFLAWQPMINNGVFAMAADAPHWERWRAHYQSALKRTLRGAPHDQFSLNAAIYLEGLPAAFLPATLNWICDLATPMWNDSDKQFCVPYAPYEPISILHLAGPAKTNEFTIASTSGTDFRSGLRRGAVMSIRQQQK